jgi:hypothetical protein
VNIEYMFERSTFCKSLFSRCRKDVFVPNWPIEQSG